MYRSFDFFHFSDNTDLG